MGGDPLATVGVLLIKTIFGLYTLIVLLRFLLQLVRADFYNPLSQFIVKATNPLVLPLRRIIPGFFGLDLSSLLLALAVQALGIFLLVNLLGISPSIGSILIWAAINTLQSLLNIFFFGIIIVVLVSWISPGTYNPAISLVSQIIDPVMAPIKRIMPDLGGLDLSPIVVFLLIQILEILFVKPLMFATGMHQSFML